MRREASMAMRKGIRKKNRKKEKMLKNGSQRARRKVERGFRLLVGGFGLGKSNDKDVIVYW